MLVKTIAISLAIAQSANTFVAGVEYWKNFKTQVDPTNITIPKIDQTTSLDPTAQCQYYTPQNFEFDPSEWPNPWEIATSNGMNETEEFKNLYNSIDWSKAPKNISVRVMNEDGSVDMSSKYLALHHIYIWYDIIANPRFQIMMKAQILIVGGPPLLVLW